MIKEEKRTVFLFRINKNIKRNDIASNTAKLIKMEVLYEGKRNGSEKISVAVKNPKFS
jgi:hypothetical protein